MSTKREDSGVIAKPCGHDCLKGNLHEGTPRGSRTTIAGVDTYIVEPREGTANGNIVLYFPDVWGFFNNGFLVMDAFADAGYLTLGLDYFQGDPVWKHSSSPMGDPNFDFEAWMKKHMPFSDEHAPKWAREVKEKYSKPGTKFACTGYCWGAPYVMNELAKDGICDVGAFAHPAFLKDSHFKNLTKPLFLSCAEVDVTFPNEFRNKAVDIMQDEKKRFQVQLFQGVAHGFALRADLNNPYALYTKEQSLKGMVEWFDFWLAQ